MLRIASRFVLTTSLVLGLGLVVSAPVARAGSLPGGVAPTLALVVNPSLSDYDYVRSQVGTLNTDGTYSAIGNGNTTGFGVSWNLTLDPDPLITGSFTLTNLSLDPQSFTVAASLGTVAMPGPNVMSGSFGDVIVTDANHDGNIAFSANPLYAATIDGNVVKTLGAMSLSLTASSFNFGSAAFGPVAALPVSEQIGTNFAFSLSAGDSVQVPFSFRVEAVPEPASLALVGVGLVGLLALRRARA